jgi:tight adherence protein C
MFPPWILATFYVVSGAAIVWLLRRLWRKRRAERRKAPVSPPASPAAEALTAAATTPGEQVGATAADTASAPLPAGTRPGDPRLLQPAAESVRAAALAGEATKLAGGAGELAGMSWPRPHLFGDRQQSRDLPERVLADQTPVARTDDYLFGPLTAAMAELFPDSAARREETRKELLAAGFYQPHALQNLSAVRYAAMMGGMVLGLVWLVLAPARWEWLALSSVVVFPLLGWALPRLYVRGRAAERRNEIERGMPDLLDMLNMCVSQGLTVPDALRRIVRDLREAYPALAQELRIVIEQAGIGDLRVALENFSQRIDIPEVHSFTSLLTQTERMGTSISDALMAYSDTMRESLRQRADEKGNRATFQLLFPTVLCLMPAVYLFLMGPAIIDLSEFFRSGGRDALDQGSRVIQRLNADRRAQLPADVPTP